MVGIRTDKGSRPAILVVEDEPDILGLLKTILRERYRSAYDVLTVTTGSAALARVSKQVIPLMVIDYQLPDTNGLELVVQVHALSPETRILLITGHSSSQLERDAYANGVDHFLAKPFALEPFEKIVRDLLVEAQLTDAANPGPVALDNLASSDAVLTAARDLYLLVQGFYARAGTPYGNTPAGLLRWAEEQWASRDAK